MTSKYPNSSYFIEVFSLIVAMSAVASFAFSEKPVQFNIMKKTTHWVTFLITFSLLAGTNLPVVIAAEKPIVEIFSASKTELDLNDTNVKIDFEAVFSHPDGIESLSTKLLLTNSKNNSISSNLTRVDSPVNYSSTKVTFRGSIILPRDFIPDVYTYSLDGVYHNLKNGIRISSGIVNGPKLRDVKGAESGIIVRSSGYLDLSYSTINGPAYGYQSGVYFENPSKYLSEPAPIWKVGEVVLLEKYFELTIPDTELQVSSKTPLVCESVGKTLKLISAGDCNYEVSLPRTKNYLAKRINQTVQITSARSSQKLFVGTVPNQLASKLPITIKLDSVYSSGLSVAELVFPSSITPEICDVAGYTLKLFGSGTCLLTYKTEGNSSYLPSDVYTQTILIERQNQTITHLLPQTVDIKVKTFALTATASGGGPITYSTASNEYCSISGSTLNLLKPGNCSVTATQSGTSILAPISAAATIMIVGSVAPVTKSIICAKGKSTKKIKGESPKCPKGYKIKK